jgi:hypothetical protein
MIVQVEDEGFDLGPARRSPSRRGLCTPKRVLSSTVKYLAVGLTGVWERLFADLDAAVPHGRPIEEVTQQVQEVLARHDVTLAGFETADEEPVS